ncbi:MAG TPA: asparagine synthase C-terminal domain-containing protein [Bryobacteraceae bacterium]|nr:asparagine synthase C-terminal domain-containing protein [Bryobacteraceae bacterium]
MQGRYWRLPAPVDQASPGWTEQKAADEVRSIFDESVRLRLISDVPLGAFLSGGIDSSSVVASMALHFADSSAIPTFVVSEFAAQHVKVVLTGDGGDELFAGYDSVRQMKRLRWADSMPFAVRSGLAHVADFLPYRTYGKNYLRMISRTSPLERYVELCSPRFLRERLLSPDWLLREGTEFLFETFPQALLPYNADILAQVQYFEATGKLAGDILVKVDRMSMANSLEVRCPLLDHHLAELAMRIPTAWKLRNGTGKMIFRRAVGDRLPPSVLARPKLGFDVPLAIWFRTSLREFLWDHLTGARAIGRGIVSRDSVSQLLVEHQSGRRNNHQWLWALLMIELWFSEFEQTSSNRAPLSAWSQPLQ